MRRLLLRTAAGLCLASLLGLGLARGSEPPGRGGKPLSLPTLPTKNKEATSCGAHGTTVEFVDTPREAARKAKDEQKLVFILHVSGNFEDPRFT